MINTLSICPECYLTIPAVVVKKDGMAVMQKECPAHGCFESVVERDADFYGWCRDNTSGIYRSHLIDVTGNCDLSCKYCYHDKRGGDVPIGHILNEARVTPGPYALIGGEPTTRQDLPELMAKIGDIGDFSVITSGTGFKDAAYLAECLDYIPMHKGYHGISLSYHPNNAAFPEIMENLQRLKVKPEVLFWVIDSLEEIPEIIRFSEAHRGMFADIRIKAASNLWSTAAAEKIFVSDMLEWFFKNEPETEMAVAGKSVFLPLRLRGIPYLLVSWHDAGNVDLLDIACPPTYRAKTGQVMNFVSAALVNEGMSKGWLNGKRI